MVRIKTKSAELRMNNPTWEIDDVPPSLVKLWGWIMSHPKKVKKELRRLWRKVTKRAGVVGTIAGTLLGFILASVFWLYVINIYGVIIA